jgi:hypothetical protein
MAGTRLNPMTDQWSVVEVSGTLSPNPWDLSLSGQNAGSILEVLERRIRLRRDAT